MLNKERRVKAHHTRAARDRLDLQDKTRIMSTQNGVRRKKSGRNFCNPALSGTSRTLPQKLFILAGTRFLAENVVPANEKNLWREAGAWLVRRPEVHA